MRGPYITDDMIIESMRRQELKKNGGRVALKRYQMLSPKIKKPYNVLKSVTEYYENYHHGATAYDMQRIDTAYFIEDEVDEGKRFRLRHEIVRHTFFLWWLYLIQSICRTFDEGRKSLNYDKKSKRKFYLISVVILFVLYSIVANITDENMSQHFSDNMLGALMMTGLWITVFVSFTVVDHIYKAHHHDIYESDEKYKSLRKLENMIDGYRNAEIRYTVPSYYHSENFYSPSRKGIYYYGRDMIFYAGAPCPIDEQRPQTFPALETKGAPYTVEHF